MNLRISEVSHNIQINEENNIRGTTNPYLIKMHNPKDEYNEKEFAHRAQIK